MLISYLTVIFNCLSLEHPLDLTILMADIQKVKARKELWELKAACTTWMEEWKNLLFSEVMLVILEKTPLLLKLIVNCVWQEILISMYLYALWSLINSLPYSLLGEKKYSLLSRTGVLAGPANLIIHY